MQSGKPVGVFRTHEWAPRVLIANSNLVGDWANWEQFRKLEAEGLMMYGQMTAGSWIYIGTQGILQGTYETFGAVAKKRFGGTLAGTITLTAGLGGMGGAQPLAVTMNEGVAICVDCDVTRIDRRIEHRYLDTKADDIDDALRLAVEARDAKRPLSIGLLGNAAEVLPELLRRDAPIDIVTDQTSAHDPLSYLPIGIDVRGHEEDGRQGSGLLHRAGAGVDGQARRGDGRLHGRAAPRCSTTATPSATRPERPDTTGLSTSPASSPPTSGRSSRRASGRSGGWRCRVIRRTSRPPTARSSSSSRTTSTSRAGSPWPARRSRSRGCPPASAGSATASGIMAGLKFNEMVASGELSAPIVIGRDHLDSGSVASPYRETEAMLDGSDAIADWPLLNALVNTASGASWVSIHHGGGVGMGRSIHAGQVTVADGTDTGRAEARAGADQRPRHGRHPARRRRLRARHRRSPPNAACESPCGRTRDRVRHPVADRSSTSAGTPPPAATAATPGRTPT